MNKMYLDLIEPTNFISNFETKKDFELWLSLGSLQDLECTLKSFENVELYEYCQIIKNKIDAYKSSFN